MPLFGAELPVHHFHGDATPNALTSKTRGGRWPKIVSRTVRLEFTFFESIGRKPRLEPRSPSGQAAALAQRNQLAQIIREVKRLESTGSGGESAAACQRFGCGGGGSLPVIRIKKCSRSGATFWVSQTSVPTIIVSN